jgi:hypothetical protein
VRFFGPLIPTDAPLLHKDRSKLALAESFVQAAAAFDPLSDPMLHCLDVFRRSLLRAGLQPTLRCYSLKRLSITDLFPPGPAPMASPAD